MFQHDPNTKQHQSPFFSFYNVQHYIQLPDKQLEILLDFDLVIHCVNSPVYTYGCTTVCVQKTICGDQFSFQQVGPKDQTQVITLGNKCLYLLSHLTSSNRSFFFFFFFKQNKTLSFF